MVMTTVRAVGDDVHRATVGREPEVLATVALCRFVRSTPRIIDGGFDLGLRQTVCAHSVPGVVRVAQSSLRCVNSHEATRRRSPGPFTTTATAC